MNYRPMDPVQETEKDLEWTILEAWNFGRFSFWPFLRLICRGHPSELNKLLCHDVSIIKD